MSKVSTFDVIARMAAEGKDIRMSPHKNLVIAEKVKRETDVTIAIQGDIVGSIVAGTVEVCLLVWDKQQYKELKSKMERGK